MKQFLKTNLIHHEMCKYTMPHDSLNGRGGEEKKKKKKTRESVFWINVTCKRKYQDMHTSYHFLLDYRMEQC